MAIFSSKVERFRTLARIFFLIQAVGEPPLFLGCCVLFAIRQAIRSYRQDKGLTGYFRLDSPLTAERIRMACDDQITKRVRKWYFEREKNYNFQMFSNRDTLWTFHPDGNWFSTNGINWTKSQLTNPIHNLAFLDYVQFNEAIFGLGHFEGNIEQFTFKPEIYIVKN